MASRATNKPVIPFVTGVVEAIARYLRPIKTVLDNYQGLGDPLDKVVTFRDIAELFPEGTLNHPIKSLTLYEWAQDPTNGPTKNGELMYINGKLKLCTKAGSPGTLEVVGEQVA